MLGLTLTKHLREREVELLGRIAELHEHNDELGAALGDYVRIGRKTLDPIAMQTQLRVIEPTMKIMVVGNDWYFYCGKSLIQSERNAIEAALGFRLDKS